MNTETHLFYFSEAHQLRVYAEFDVQPVTQPRLGQNPSAVTVYTVVGHLRDEDRSEVIAEFPLELHAMIFKDMARATAAVTVAAMAYFS
jgi:hypothetical protein